MSFCMIKPTDQTTGIVISGISFGVGTKIVAESDTNVNTNIIKDCLPTILTDDGILKQVAGGLYVEDYKQAYFIQPISSSDLESRVIEIGGVPDEAQLWCAKFSEKEYSDFEAGGWINIDLLKQNSFKVESSQRKKLELNYSETGTRYIIWFKIPLESLLSLTNAYNITYNDVEQIQGYKDLVIDLKNFGVDDEVYIEIQYSLIGAGQENLPFTIKLSEGKKSDSTIKEIGKPIIIESIEDLEDSGESKKIFSQGFTTKVPTNKVFYCFLYTDSEGVGFTLSSTKIEKISNILTEKEYTVGSGDTKREVIITGKINSSLADGTLRNIKLEVTKEGVSHYSKETQAEVNSEFSFVVLIDNKAHSFKVTTNLKDFSDTEDYEEDLEISGTVSNVDITFRYCDSYDEIITENANSGGGGTNESFKGKLNTIENKQLGHKRIYCFYANSANEAIDSKIPGYFSSSDCGEATIVSQYVEGDSYIYEFQWSGSKTADKLCCFVTLKQEEYNGQDIPNFYIIQYLYYNPCLAKDTLITMPNKELKPIQDIQVGDYVLSRLNKISKVYKTTKGFSPNFHTLYFFENGTIIDETGPHCFYNVEHDFQLTLREWQIGEHALDQNNQPVALISKKVIEEPAEQYGIWIENDTYYANGLLSGNDRYNLNLLEDSSLDKAAEMLASVQTEILLDFLKY